MRYNIRHETMYSYSEPVPICHNLVHLAPRNTEQQTCRNFELVVDPVPTIRTKRQDYFGNDVEYFSVQEAHDGLSVIAECVVEVNAPPAAKKRPESPAWEDTAAAIHEDITAAGLSVYHFSLPSPRVLLSQALVEYALPSFTKRRPIFEAARDLTARIHADFKFDPKATTVHTPAEEFLELRRGVCQDFAHLAVGCLRSMGLAARYVSGYVCTSPPPGMPRLQGADASHAWVSVYCGKSGWIDFDPTNDAIVGDSHVTIGWGRDYGDLCPIQGVFVGGGDQGLSVGVDVVPVEAS